MQRLTLLAALIPLAACESPEEPSSRSVFDEHCAACHGVTGTGDGPAAASLSTKPADLTLLSQNNGGTFPYAAVMTHIDGYTRRDTPGDPMPEFGNYLSGETVPFDSGDGILTTTPVELVDMANYLKSIQK